MSNITQLTGAIRFALLAGAASVLAAPAFAQATDETQTLDRVEVTGSRIRQVDLATPAPVIAITRADIEKQGFQSVSDIIQQVSAFGTPTITRAQPLSAGELAGGAYVSMRNLGAARTLVLVNGRRLGISTSGLSDLATIPAAAVERIEVLKDGASSLYGSDAIGGVVNIITVSDYEGMQASSYYGQYSEGDGETTRADMRLGYVGDRGSLTLAAEWAKEEKVAATDRFFSAFPRSAYHPTDNWTTVSQFGTFTVNAANPITGLANGTYRLRPGGNPQNRADYVRINDNIGGCNFATGVCTVGSTEDKTNTLQQTDLRTPLQSRGLFVAGSFDINDYVRFKTDFTYAYRDANRRVAGFPYQASVYSSPLSASSYFNPFGQPVNFSNRTFDVPRDSRSELTTYRFTGGFEGSLEFGDRYVDWDAAYVYNKNKSLQSTIGNLNVTRVLQAVGPSFLNANGVVQCGTAANPIPLLNCTPWNPLIPAGQVAPGGLAGNTALRNFLFQTEHTIGETSTEVITLNASGNLFALPAGDLMYAVGYENRKEAGAFVPDALAQTGSSTNLAAGPTRGNYAVDEFYVELQVPVLMDMAFAKELSLQLASRYSDYDTFGDTTNDKLGLKWQPIEGVLIRGTVADGFRAPTIADLFGGGSQTFSNFTDPCDTNFGSAATNLTTRANCARDLGATRAATFRQLGQGFNPVGAPNTQTPVAFTNGSNPNLQPETSRSKTLGVVWSPGFAEGLNLSLDWWNVRIDDTIVADSATDILNDCYVQGIASRCSLFTRDATLGFVNNMLIAGRNAGYREIEGFDFDWTYRFELGEIGAFTVANNTTYTSKDIFVSTNDPRFPISSVGVAGNASTTFRIRSNLNVGWEKGDWGVNWTSRYYSSIAEACTYITECNQIQFAPTGTYIGNNPANGPASALRRRMVHGANTFHDLQVRWNAPWNATISAGANNVFGHIGPVLYSQPSANVPYYGGFDIGRFWYMKYSQRF